jgi:transmembrane 9 superfamily protein 2/4
MNREMREETGWKLVYADVFRPPPHAALLSVYAGSGMQLFVMSILTLTFAAFGFLSPANRGALLSSILFFYVLMGVPAGYTAARFCKLVKEPNHFKTTLLTSVIFPGVCFAMFFVINMVVWTRQSSTAVPFGTLVVLMLLWFEKRSPNSSRSDP